MKTRTTKLIKKIFLTAAALLTLSLCFVSCMKQGDFLVQEGAKLFNQKKFDAARNDFTAALDLECSYSKDTIYIFISNCYSQEADYDNALEWRQKALAIEEDADNLTNIGFLYRLKGNDEEAEKYYKRSIELNDNDPSSLASLGSLYMTHEKYEEAIPLLEKASDLEEKSGLIHADLAVCYARQGRIDDAEEEYEIAVNCKADNLDVFRQKLDEIEAEVK